MLQQLLSKPEFYVGAGIGLFLGAVIVIGALLIAGAVDDILAPTRRPGGGS